MCPSRLVTYAGLKPGHWDGILVRFVHAEVHHGLTQFRMSDFRCSVELPMRVFLWASPIHQVIERAEALRLRQLQD